MAPRELFDADSGETEQALMAATYRALCEHGYADLTIQKIGAEFEKSASLLYHHHDGKDDLLVAFVPYVLERFESDVPSSAVDDHWTRLVGLLDHVLAPSLTEDRYEFTSAMVELRAQAAHHPEYREAFTRHDEFFHDRLSTVILEGIDAGRFRDVDPDAVAALVQTVFNGAMLQRVTTDDAVAVDDVRSELESMLAARLLPEGGG